MLEIKDLNVSYGAVHAIHGISLEVHDGEIVSLIGANGAGKTTVLRTISGLKKADSGEIRFDDCDLRKTEPSRIINLKLAHVPEGRHIFPQMTVEENLEMGAYADGKGKEENMAGVYGRFPRLKERRRQLAGTLSGVEQQMLAVGRALMAKPKMILMDEPSMGLSPLLAPPGAQARPGTGRSIRWASSNLWTTPPWTRSRARYSRSWMPRARSWA